MVTVWSSDIRPASTACITDSATQSLETLCCGKVWSPSVETRQPCETSLTAMPTGSRWAIATIRLSLGLEGRRPGRDGHGLHRDDRTLGELTFWTAT